MNRKAFTLVELLVVIAIIALLMSILMPTLARVRRQAKVVICESNLKQWGAVFSMYTDDHGGYFQEGWGTGTGDSNWWMDATRRYYVNYGDIRCCPEASNQNKLVDDGEVNFGVWSDPTGSFLSKGDYGSYGINGWVENRVEEVPSYEWMADLRWRTPIVKDPARTPLVLDAPWIDTWPQEYDNPPTFDNWYWGLGSHMARFCKNRHSGFINCLFLDYSVRTIGLKEMWTLKWHRTYDVAGIWTTAGGVDRNDWPDWMRGFTDY